MEIDAKNKQPVNPTEIELDKPKRLVRYLQSDYNPYVKLAGCYRLSQTIEAVEIDVDVEVGQAPKFDIRKAERILVAFDPEDKDWPEVVALREDFPAVPHINLRSYEYPRSLCLYDEAYSEVKLSWTPHMFVETLRNWLKETALGTLHDDDQPLEPLIGGNCSPCVLPESLLEDGGPEEVDLILIEIKLKMQKNLEL